MSQDKEAKKEVNVYPYRPESPESIQYLQTTAALELRNYITHYKDNKAHWKVKQVNGQVRQVQIPNQFVAFFYKDVSKKSEEYSKLNDVIRDETTNEPLFDARMLDFWKKSHGVATMKPMDTKKGRTSQKQEKQEKESEEQPKSQPHPGEPVTSPKRSKASEPQRHPVDPRDIELLAKAAEVDTRNISNPIRCTVDNVDMDALFKCTQTKISAIAQSGFSHFSRNNFQLKNEVEIPVPVKRPAEAPPSKDIKEMEKKMEPDKKTEKEHRGHKDHRKHRPEEPKKHKVEEPAKTKPEPKQEEVKELQLPPGTPESLDAFDTDNPFLTVRIDQRLWFDLDVGRDKLYIEEKELHESIQKFLRELEITNVLLLSEMLEAHSELVRAFAVLLFDTNRNSVHEAGFFSAEEEGAKVKHFYCHSPVHDNTIFHNRYLNGKMIHRHKIEITMNALLVDILTRFGGKGKTDNKMLDKLVKSSEEEGMLDEQEVALLVALFEHFFQYKQEKTP